MTRGAATPYDILGISPEASLEEIRQAYRRGALKYHPDNHHLSPIEAEEKFRTLAKAYKAALRAHLPKYKDFGGSRPCSPADFARMDTRWHACRAGDRYIPGNTEGWPMHGTTKSRSVPTVDENRVFVLAWAVATILGIIAMFLTGPLGLLGEVHGEMELSDILAAEMMALFIIAALIAGAIYVIVLTRKTIWLTLQLGVRLLPFIPTIRKLPQSAPREA
ncbi:MAG: J domain-containing protein [Phycisphaerae bacterium]|nr:J domain-containing protein [Phycisphaerae bacterium]